jgi:MoxR-like ATPase
VRILQETRETKELVIGASPRAGEHLLYAAKAYALIHGKNYVIPDYVKSVAPKVLGHRVILSAESELEGLSSQKVVNDILSRVEIPDILESEITTK